MAKDKHKADNKHKNEDKAAVETTVDETAILLAQKEEELQKIKSELLYQRADFDNIRKRIEKRCQDTLTYACEPIGKDLIGVVDNLERALSHVSPDENAAIYEGLTQILDQFKGVLKKHGIEEMDALGKKFDPNFHEALALIPGEEDNKVASVEEKGYTLNGKLMRPAKVLVTRLA